MMAASNPATPLDGADDRYLITGATGFIGQRVLAALTDRGADCRVLSRRVAAPRTVLGDLADVMALDAACEGIGCVIHCAGYAHAFASRSEDEASQHWAVNFEGTRNLIEAAGQAGGRRFVFLSSVKAIAEPGDSIADEDFPGEPDTDYGRAKRAAEAVVLSAAERYGMHVVNLRLSMVYGAGGRGNVERMGRLVCRGLFPPLPETGNRRSLVHVDDVVAAILAVAADSRACGRTYNVCGPEAPSGRQLFDALREACGLPRCGWTMPRALLAMAANAGDVLGNGLGRRLPLNREVLQRLLGSACYDGSRIFREIGWQPNIRLREGLREMLRT